jgi:hypothetical protein
VLGGLARGRERRKGLGMGARCALRAGHEIAASVGFGRDGDVGFQREVCWIGARDVWPLVGSGLGREGAGGWLLAVNVAVLRGGGAGVWTREVCAGLVGENRGPDRRGADELRSERRVASVDEAHRTRYPAVSRSATFEVLRSGGVDQWIWRLGPSHNAGICRSRSRVRRLAARCSSTPYNSTASSWWRTCMVGFYQ